jgi:antitoxin (DNA-binding transcriptional repressor) of toxin-antitoxin stability system
MDQVSRTGEGIIVTKHGKPVARLVPMDAQTPRHTFGLLSDQTEIYGDIVEPTDESWHADE